MISKFLAFGALLSGALAKDVLSADFLAELQEVVDTSTEHHAPTVSLLSEPAAPADYLPVVLVHGMGDSGTNAGMQSLCKTVSTKYPGMYAVCSTVADGTASITTRLDPQIEEFTKSVRADPKLANGFSAVGLSQGNLVLRGYIEKVNDPPVHKFISICGPHGGEGSCPDNLLYKIVCPLWRLGPYTAPLAFSDYWKDVTNKATYLEKSRWLADVNNERDTKNATYKENFASLTKYVMIEALNDTIVEPHASESHGFWAWGSKPSDSTLVQYKDTEGYKQDFIGLKTLDDAGKLDYHTYVGDHLRFSSQFWDDTVLPYLAD